MNLHPISALGTVWHIEILDAHTDCAGIQAATEDFLNEFERRYSRFKADSWLSQLNREGVFVTPDPEFVSILRSAIQFYEKTNHVFNIAVGDTMVASGYDQNYSFTMSDAQPSVPALSEVLEVSAKRITLSSGSIDLGGIGKGFVIDALAQMYTEKLQLRYFLINGGGDIYATSDNGRPLTVTLTHPTNTELGIGVVDLHNQGFAASSPHVRTWTDKITGQVQNHLNTEVGVTSYVVAPDACTADVWATSLAIQPELQSISMAECLLLQEVTVLHSDTIFKLHR
jgi:thiamine biosynthesis lipoprotein